TVQKIADELKLPLDEIVYALDSIQEPVSLFEPPYHNAGDPIYVMDQVSDESQQDAQWLEGTSIRQALHRLNERKRPILTLSSFEGKTQMEVAEEFCISQAQVSRLEKAALSHMRKYV